MIFAFCLVFNSFFEHFILFIYSIKLQNLIYSQEFLNNAAHGLIYVNVGEKISQSIKDRLLEIIKDFQQHFIWENCDFNGNVPSNLQICNKHSRKLILSHKNTVLSITSDDSKIIKQALHFGIPILITMPFQNNKV